MCSRCEWKTLVSVVKSVVDSRPPALVERQRDWLEAIMVTVDDDHHCTDHQKTVIKRILRERGIDAWRTIPKAMDHSEWSVAKRRRHVENKKLARQTRAYGAF